MEEKSVSIVERLLRIDSLMKRYQGQRLGRRRTATTPHRGQGRVLSLLRLQPEITQKDLGYLLDMRTQSLGELLSKLEKAGYVTKRPSETDRRSMVVSLTPEGAKAAENLDDDASEWGAVFADFSAEEADQLIGLLDRLIAALEQAAGAEDEDRAGHAPSMPDHPGFFGGFENFADFGEHMAEHAARMGMNPRAARDARQRPFAGFGERGGFDPRSVAGADPRCAGGVDPRSRGGFDPRGFGGFDPHAVGRARGAEGDFEGFSADRPDASRSGVDAVEPASDENAGASSEKDAEK